MSHSILPPSGAGAWVHCPLWVTMNFTHPQAETSDTIEGTAIHAIAEKTLKTWLDHGYLLPSESWIGQTVNGVIVTERMVHGAMEYVHHCMKLVEWVGSSVNATVEERVAIKRVHEQCFGTLDFAMYDAARDMLHIVDGKFGHRVVEAFEHWQGVMYALGKIDQICGDFADAEMTLRVAITIVQPFAPHPRGPVRTWTVPARDLRGMANQLHNAAHEALGGNPRAVVGSHCRDCPGRHACPALREAGSSAVAFARESVTPESLPVEAMALERHMLDDAMAQIKARMAGLDAQITHTLEKGTPVPGVALDATKTRAQWSVPMEKISALGRMFNVRLTTEKPITPLQAIKEGVPENVVKEMMHYPPGKPKLIFDHNRLAKEVFRHD